MTISLTEPKSLKAADALVIDARREDEYLAGHIPGAIQMGWEEWCGQPPDHAGPALALPGYWGLLAEQPIEWYEERLSALGLRHDRPMVIYANGASSKGREGRIAWMLLYLGAQHVSLLNGGWPGWIASGGEVESEPARLPADRFTVSLQPHRRTRLDDLRHAMRSGELPVLVDTRSDEEFGGRRYRYLPRPGHLPSAFLVSYSDLFQPNGRYVDAEHFQARLPAGLGEERIVAYCEVGVRASGFAILHEIHTGRPAAVFDGSLIEWGLKPELPVEVGAGALRW